MQKKIGRNGCKINFTYRHLLLNSLQSFFFLYAPFTKITKRLILHFLFTAITVLSLLFTHQLDDLDENPVIGGGGHELEEEWSQRQVVLGISASQLTDDVDCCRLDT